MPRPRLAFAASTLAVVVAACGTSTEPTATTAGPQGPRPSGPGVTARPSAASPLVPGAGSPRASGRAVADATLLAVVHPASAGLTLTFDRDTTATELADPTLDPKVQSLATGIAVPTGVASPAELVIVNVARLSDAGLNEDWFRGWRDSYDMAACVPAGGLTGHAESTVGGHDVFIGSCANGVFTYHTRLSGGGIVVSLTSIGPSRLGERLLDDLAP